MTLQQSGPIHISFVGVTLSLVVSCAFDCSDIDRPKNPTVADALVEKPPTCLMRPPFRHLDIPEHGMQMVGDGGAAGSCDVMPRKRTAGSSGDGSSQLLVDAAGPAGSGRYWTVTVGLVEPASAPDPDPRGICLRTSTIGWRSLQRLGNTALPWTGDRDADGSQELILWHSFPLDAQAEASDFGLTAWIYEHRFDDRLLLDVDQSRKLAREIATEYRNPIEGSTERLQRERTRASNALTDFADAKCSLGS